MLSTNWEDVKKSEVTGWYKQPTHQMDFLTFALTGAPPKGMEAKKWNE